MWDNSIALEFFTLKMPFLIVLQNKKSELYTYDTIIAITNLYAKLIKYKDYKLAKIENFWNTVRFCKFQSQEHQQRFLELIKAFKN